MATAYCTVAVVLPVTMLLLWHVLIVHVLLHLYRYLVSIGCIKPLCDMLGVQDPRVIQIILEGLENILKVGQLDVEKNGGINPFAVLIEEAFGKY